MPGSVLTEKLREVRIDGVPEHMKIPEEDRPVEAEYDSIDLPLVDLSLMNSDRAGLVKRFGEAASTWGIFRVTNHGVPSDLMKEVEEDGLKFFHQSEEDKLKLLSRDHVHASKGCYYTGNNIEEKRHSLHWAESYVMWFGQWNALDPTVIERVTCDWTTADERFRTAMLEYLTGVRAAAKQLFQLAAESLGLETDYFSSPGVVTGNIVIRWNYYPACPLPEDVLGAHSHTDPTLLTILQQDKVGGLQVERDGRWYNVKPVEDTFIVNISDQFHIWSNGIFKSVLHRVLVSKEVHRLSIASILSLIGDQSLSAASELIDENHPRVYKDLKAQEQSQVVMDSRKASSDTKVFNGFNYFDSLKA
ncbi:hypothetical protein Mapa_014570 [Marchantia paleacea]|nr:hypothetical protein Mapa_014570 [Marchantia paleacea]